MSYTIYNPFTGQIVKSVQTDNANPVTVDSPFEVIDGYYSSYDYYIDNGAAVLYPEKPAENPSYYFDYITKQWVLNNRVAEINARNERNGLLAQVDRVNPIWYASLTQEQQQELQTYRQALLDITAQAAWPNTVEWPTKPAWL